MPTITRLLAHYLSTAAALFMIREGNPPLQATMNAGREAELPLSVAHLVSRGMDFVEFLRTLKSFRREFVS